MHRRFPCSSGPDSTQTTHHEVNGHAVWKYDTPAIIIVDITRPHWPCSLDQGTAGFYAHTPGTTAAWSHLRCRVGRTGGDDITPASLCVRTTTTDSPAARML